MTHFSFPQTILFKHCDPAGIGFYPRYVEIINDAVEAMFAELIGWPFADMVAEGGGVPTARLNVDFTAPCRLGDRIVLEISIERLGRSSMGLQIVARAGAAEQRFAVSQVLVCTGPDGRPRDWPGPVRARIASIMEGSA